MLERCRHATWGETHVQRFTVAYDLPVVFTRDAFDAANPTFADALRRREPDKRHRMAVFVDSGVLAAMPALERAHPPLRRGPCGLARDRGRHRRRAGRRGGKDPRRRRREPPRRARAPRHRPALLRGRDRRRRGARRRRLRRLDLPPRRAARAAADDGAGPGRQRRRREERRQCLRHEEPRRGLCAAVRDRQRRRLHRPPAAAGEAQRHVRSREGGVDPRPRLLRVDRGQRRRARRLPPEHPRPADRALGATPHATDRRRRRPVRDRVGAPARLWPLVGAPAREPDRAQGRPRRGGRDRRRARHPLRRPRRPPAGGRGRARAPPVDEARLQPLVRRAPTRATATGSSRSCAASRSSRSTSAAS